MPKTTKCIQTLVLANPPLLLVLAWPRVYTSHSSMQHSARANHLILPDVALRTNFAIGPDRRGGEDRCLLINQSPTSGCGSCQVHCKKSWREAKTNRYEEKAATDTETDNHARDPPGGTCRGELQGSCSHHGVKLFQQVGRADPASSTGRHMPQHRSVSRQGKVDKEHESGGGLALKVNKSEGWEATFMIAIAGCISGFDACQYLRVNDKNVYAHAVNVKC
jgi:hypothetical protein